MYREKKKGKEKGLDRGIDVCLLKAMESPDEKESLSISSASKTRNKK